MLKTFKAILKNNSIQWVDETPKIELDNSIKVHITVYFEEFFNASQILPVSQVVIEQGVRLKQIKKISLGDAIIAGTALVYDLTVVTRNIDDFRFYLALGQLVYKANFDETIQVVVDENQLKLIIIDTDKEVITKWIS
jgi:hypothetical protein